MSYTVGFYALSSGQVVEVEEIEPMKVTASPRLYQMDDTVVFE